MSAVYPHARPHGGPTPRLVELLEAIKAEFDSASSDSSMVRAQREEFEQRLSSQIQEMTQIQQNLYELERAHQKMKQHYEEEIMRLRRELEARGGSAKVGAMLANPLPPLLGGGGPDPLSGAQSAFPAGAPNSTIPGKPAPQLPKQTVFGDIDLDSIPSSLKKEGSDWLSVANPKTSRKIDIDLMHNLEHASVVCCVKFSDDGKYLATGCNRTAQIFDVTTGNLVSTLVEDSESKDDLYIRSVCFSPDGKYLVTGAEDKLIRIWDIAEKKIWKRFAGHEQDIYSLDYSRDGRLVISGSGDRTVRIWEVETEKCLFVLGNEENSQKDAGVTSVALSPDGQLIAAGSLDRAVKLWETNTGRFLARVEGHTDSVYSVAFSPDGKYVISGSLDKTLKMWEVNLDSPAKVIYRSTCVGHKDFVLSVCFASEGNWMVSGSKDRTVLLWDADSSQPCVMLQGHKNSVISIALSQGTHLLATGSGDCRARIWSCKPIG